MSQPSLSNPPSVSLTGTVTIGGTAVLQFGSTVASAGTIQFGKAPSVQALDNAGTGNIGMISTDASDDILIGDGTNGADVRLNPKSSANVLVQFGGTTKLTISEAASVTTIAGVEALTISLAASKLFKFVATTFSWLDTGANLLMSINVTDTHSLNLGVDIRWINGKSTAAIITTDHSTTNSGTGQTLSVGGQANTGTTSIGGGLTLFSGNGTSTPGVVAIKSGCDDQGAGGVAIANFGGNAPMSFASSSVAFTNADVTLSAAQSQTPIIVVTGMLSGNVNLVFPNSAGIWFVDTAGLVTGGNTFTFKSGSGTQTLALVSSQSLYVVYTTGSNGVRYS